MKKIAAVVALATLGGCAVYQPGPANYTGRANAASFDPYQWHTVAVEPAYVTRYNAAPTYYPRTYSRPIYAPQAVYAPQPYYAYPPVTIGFDFMFGRWYGSRHGGHGRHGHHRGHGRH